MIGDLVNGREKSSILLVKDFADASGRPVLACFLVSLAQRFDEVHVICFDSRSRDLLHVVNLNISPRVKFHDGSSDLLNWNKRSQLHVDTDLSKFVQSQIGCHGNKKIAVVIDSISPLILHRPVPYTCQTINRLRKTEVNGTNVEQVICLLHSDLHDKHSMSMVEHVSSSVLTMEIPDSGDSIFCCNTLHKKPSGKIIKIREHFNLTNTFEIVEIKEVKSTVIPNKSDQTEQVNPAANLTFNLSLSEKEIKDRSNVKLPYMYNEQRQEETLLRSVGEGKIFYQPDEADDFDEEDPDDDLDI